MTLRVQVPARGLFFGGSMSLVSSLGNLIKPITQEADGKGAARRQAEGGGCGDATTRGGRHQRPTRSKSFSPRSAHLWGGSCCLRNSCGRHCGLYFRGKGSSGPTSCPPLTTPPMPDCSSWHWPSSASSSPFSGLFVPATKEKKAESRATAAQAKRAQTAARAGTSCRGRGSGRPGQKGGGSRAGGSSPAVSGGQEGSGGSPEGSGGGPDDDRRYQSARAVLSGNGIGIGHARVRRTRHSCRSVETPSPAKASAASSAPAPANDPNRVLDLLVTGLVVGAGTKPLHDLITQVQTSSGSSKAKASSTTLAS